MNRHFKQIKEFKDYYITINGVIYSKKSNKYIKHNNKFVVLHKNGKKYVRSIPKIISIVFGENEKINIDKKQFRPVLGFENYYIDKFGNVISSYINGFKKGFTNSSGYKCIFLSKNGKLHNKLIHRLVYESWKGKIDENLTIDHIDENKENNCIENLQILSRSENVLKFHLLRGRKREIEGFVQIENFDNYYINQDGVVISFKYGENYHEISYDENGLFLRKDNKRHYVSVNYLLNKYFNKPFNKQRNRKYKNID